MGIMVAGYRVLLKGQKDQIRNDRAVSQDVDKSLLLKSLEKELNHSRAARYLNLPVLGSACSERLPGLYRLHEGRLQCTRASELNISAGSHPFYANAISKPTAGGFYVEAKIFSKQNNAAPGQEEVSLLNQRNADFNEAEEATLNQLATATPTFVAWPLRDTESKPFLTMSRKDISGALQYRYTEDAAFQPNPRGAYSSYTTLASLRRDIDLSQVVGNLAIVVNEAAPDQYFAKIIDRALRCVPRTDDFRDCLEMICGDRQGSAAAQCRERLTADGNDANAPTRYLVRFTSVNSSSRMTTQFQPQNYYIQDSPPGWMNQDTSFFLFPTRVASSFVMRTRTPSMTHGIGHAGNVASVRIEPLVEGEVDLKLISLRSEELPEYRVNWQVIPMRLTRYFLKPTANVGSDARGSSYRFDLMAQEFANDDQPEANEVFLMRVPDGYSLIFARQLGDSMFTLFEENGTDSIKKIASFALGNEYFPAMSTPALEYAYANPVDGSPPAASAPPIGGVLAGGGLPTATGVTGNTRATVVQVQGGIGGGSGAPPALCGGSIHNCDDNIATELHRAGIGSFSNQRSGGPVLGFGGGGGGARGPAGTPFGGTGGAGSGGATPGGRPPGF